MNKEALRKQYLQLRQALSEEEVDKRSQQICDQLFGSGKLKEVKYLHCFLPIRHKKEVNTWIIVDRIRQEQPQSKVIVSTTNWTAKRMDHFFLEESGLIEESKLGIPEPVDAPVCPAQKIELVLLPLLAFDQKGQRVGYGAGFYDRFLSECMPGTQKVGLSLFGPTSEPVTDVHELDIPLDSCVTPEKVYNF
ncbi:5-formyltetrahydrofolate cyclo-ligase [Nafulsella turpanensis]|uniref:5-formyltetrahydrofolate cyclo-ligase n=1 Tax=Nafulsella turpanensis TaxID=1265690 RepID=UPI000347B5F4|nr:5-formyltetrahydrofolate cyclo-ligase [Nafulsella turpanensis]